MFKTIDFRLRAPFGRVKDNYMFTNLDEINVIAAKLGLKVPQSTTVNHVTCAVTEEATGVQDIAEKSSATVKQADSVNLTNAKNLKGVEALQEIMARFKMDKND